MIVSLLIILLVNVGWLDVCRKIVERHEGGFGRNHGPEKDLCFCLQSCGGKGVER